MQASSISQRSNFSYNYKLLEVYGYSHIVLLNYQFKEKVSWIYHNRRTVSSCL